MKKSIISILGATLLLSSVGTTSLLASSPKKAQSKPFLIQGKLPHLTMMVKAMWDDADLALTPKQKKQLLVIRKETVSGAKALAKQINPLEAKIAQASKKGATPESLQDDVKKVAQLRAQATMLHLKCIYNTRKVLTQDQIDILE